jgi:hypothetical protein
VEDPEAIQQNIRHYQELLTLESTKETRNRILELLAEAQAQLPGASAAAMERKR